MTTVYDFSVKTATGEIKSMKDYAGKVLLLVNTASECGFTPQYAGLEQLHQTYFERGLRVLGFPCNQFGGQEPGSDAEIQRFCDLTYHVTFPIMAKIEVNGANADPLFKYLQKQQPGLLGTEAIKWNFTKFLVDRHGHPVQRFAPRDSPASMAKEIEALVA